MHTNTMRKREYKLFLLYYFSFQKLYESICPVRDTFEDLREAIEYIELKIATSNSITKKPIKLLDFFTIHSEYV